MNDNILKFRIPRWKELPNVDLYVDQVVILIDDILTLIKSISKSEQDNNTILTKNMINNYVKNKIIEAPVGKKYSKKLVAKFIIICIFKEVYKIEEIKILLSLAEHDTDFGNAYDILCSIFEDALDCIFNQKEFVGDYSDENNMGLLKSVLFACAYSIYTKKEISSIELLSETIE